MAGMSTQCENSSLSETNMNNKLENGRISNTLKR